MSSDWDALRARVRGALALPGEPGYVDAAPWVMSAPVFRPAAVLAAEGADDVVQAVRWAAANGLRVAVQATGHHATRVGEDVLLLDTRAMNDVTIDQDSAVAIVGAGCTWERVLTAAAEHGLLPVCGSAPGISAIGFLVGGGVGPLSRTLGIGSDRVRSFTVVTGDGRLRQATANENPDLFWGLRGGKATLGIVVAAEVEMVRLQTFLGGAFYFAGADITSVARAWAPWADALPLQANTSMAIMQLPADAPAPPEITGRMVLAVRFAWVGDEAEGREVVAAISSLGTPVFGSVERISGAELGTIHSDPVDPMPFRDEGFLLREFPAAALDALLAGAGPGSGSTLAFTEVRRLGGRAGEVAAQPDAFCGRVGEWSLWVGSPPVPDQDSLLACFEEILEPLRPWSAARSMPNFLLSDDPADMDRLWDPETLDRLRGLADEYDPDRVLAVGQVAPRSIPVG